MNEKKSRFKKVLNDVVLRKHRYEMRDLEHFYRKRNVGELTVTNMLADNYIEEYGIKWNGGSITCREFPNLKTLCIYGKLGSFIDQIWLEGENIDFKKTVTNLVTHLEFEWLQTT